MNNTTSALKLSDSLPLDSSFDTSLDISGTSVTNGDTSVQKVNSGASSSVDDYKSKNDTARHKLAELLLGYIRFLERQGSEHLWDIGVNRKDRVRVTKPKKGQDRFRDDWLDGVGVLRRKALNLAKCGDVLKVGCHQCGGDDLLDIPQHCRSRVCTSCATVRRSEWVEKFLPVLEKYDAKRLRHMTLTLKNCEDLRAGLQRLVKSFRTLRLIHFPDKFEGGLVGYEAHVGLDDKWNVHCHILYAGGHIKQSELSEVWHKITGDSKIVYINSISKHGYKCKHRKKKISAHQSALEYLLKYVTKGVGIDRDTITDSKSLDTFDWSASDWEQNTSMSPVKQHKVVNIVRGADKAGDWNIATIARFLLETHNLRLLQPFGSFMGAVKTEEKQVFGCPKCGSEMYYLKDPAGHCLYDAFKHYGVYANIDRVRAGPQLYKATKVRLDDSAYIAMEPECDGMVQTDFFDDMMAVLPEHPDVYLDQPKRNSASR